MTRLIIIIAALLALPMQGVAQDGGIVQTGDTVRLKLRMLPARFSAVVASIAEDTVFFSVRQLKHAVPISDIQIIERRSEFSRHLVKGTFWGIILGGAVGFAVYEISKEPRNSCFQISAGLLGGGGSYTQCSGSRVNPNETLAWISSGVVLGTGVYLGSRQTRTWERARFPR